MTEGSVANVIPDQLARRWSISSAFLIADTPSSLVYRVRLEGGKTAVFKSLKPRGMGELPGMAFLEWRKGRGAVRILERDGTACLLEDAGETTLRDYRLEHGEAASNQVITQLLEKLHSIDTAPSSGLTPLVRHFQALFERAQPDARLREPLGFCTELAKTLLSEQDNIRPLHGDIHHDNIITGGPRGWLAIDPQGLLGDPAYDVANIFGNPLYALPDIIDPHRIATLSEIFARTLGCTKDKILRYAIAHAGLSICWSIEDGTPLEASENACERLDFLNVARAQLS